MTLLFRVDANRRMGTGHLMRCLALAQGWAERDRKVVFRSRWTDRTLRDRLAEERFEVCEVAEAPGSAADARSTARVAREVDAHCVVVDGYHLDARFQDVLASATDRTIVLIDDLGSGFVGGANIVVNQNCYAHAGMYGATGALLLLGNRYVLLRREFRQWLGRVRSVPSAAGGLIVVMGGSDPHDVTGIVLEGLTHADMLGTRATVIVGAANPRVDSIQKRARELGDRVRVLSDVRRISVLFAEADLAVTAAGSTVWELAFMGVPALMISVAENQRPIAKAVGAAGAGIDLGWHEEVTAESLADTLSCVMRDARLRAEMSLRGPELVDGRGIERVIDAIESRAMAQG